MHVAHFSIPSIDDKRGIAGCDKGFDDGGSARSEHIKNSVQVFLGIFAVIYHTHGEYHIKLAPFGGELLDCERQYGGGYIAQESAYCPELSERSPVRFDAESEPGACSGHAAEVIS